MFISIKLMSNFKRKKKIFLAMQSFTQFLESPARLLPLSLTTSHVRFPSFTSFLCLFLCPGPQPLCLEFLVYSFSACNFVPPSSLPSRHVFHTHCCKSNCLSIWCKCVVIIFLVTQYLQAKVSMMWPLPIFIFRVFLDPELPFYLMLTISW